MTQAVQLRKGTTSEHASFTGLQAEATVDTTKKTIVIHDGSTAGGVPLSREDLSNSNPTNLSAINGADTASSDLFVVYDVSASALKKITRAELNNAIEQDALASVAITGGTINNTAIGGSTAAAGSFTTLTTSSTVTLNGGTANGVLYLNGSKVATSGSALTFDGTVLAVNGGTNGSRFSVRGTGAFGGFDTGSANDGRIEYAYNGTNIFYTGIDSASLMTLMARSGVSLAFGANGTEQMRLTSTGLGIGTSSPGAKLHTQSAIGGTQGIFECTSGSSYLQVKSNNSAAVDAALMFTDGTNTSYFGAMRGSSGGVTGALQAYTGGAIRLTLDSSGNLGLGVTPSFRFHTASSAFQDNVVGIQQGTGQTTGNQNRIQFLDQNGTTAQINAYGGAYGAGFNLGLILGSNYLNTTALGGTFNYSQNGFASRYRQVNSQHIWETAPSGTAGNAITFTQAMTLDADGYLLVGTTTRNTDTSIPVQINAGSNQLRGFSVNRENSYGISIGYNNVTGNDYGEIRVVPSKPLVFFTNNTERARITSGGDLLVGTTSYGGGSNVAGFGANPVGQIAVERDGGIAGVFNRFTSDGQLIIFRRSGTTVGDISVTTTATSYNTSSDYRLKDNQAPLIGSGAFIDALKPKTWTWKADGSKGVGFIAHEVQAVSPNSVVGEKDAVDEEGKPIMQAMEYGSAEFIANIIAELQSLRQRVALLEGN